MSIRFEEKPGSGNMTEKPPSLEKLYYCSGSVNESQVINIARAATAPTVATPMGILYRQDIKLSWSSANYCTVSVPYGPKNKDLGSYSVSFGISGGTAHITNSLETIARYGPGGEGGVNAPDMKGAIDYDGDEVKGTDKYVPQLKFDILFSHPLGVINWDQVRNLARTAGYQNEDEFFGFEPGEVLFVGCDGSMGSEQETQIHYEFACQENATGDKALTFGDIANVEKRGWDYLWVKYKDFDDPATGLPTRIPKHVYVERIYPETAFVGVFGFGG